jgi:parallel beta-helix repeat protein
MKHVRLSISLVLMFFFLSIYVPTFMFTETKAAFLPHTPILITCDEDLLEQAKAEGWEGSGKPKEPITIAKLNITSTITCINISNTRLDFTISDCLLSASMNSGNPAVSFLNATRGSIIGCDILFHSTGVYLFNSTYCWLSDNFISSSNRGFYLNSTNHCTLQNNIAASTIISYGGQTSFYLELSQDCFLIDNRGGGNPINSESNAFTLTIIPQVTAEGLDLEYMVVRDARSQIILQHNADLDLF